jgi:hypothetical protein
LSIVANVKKQNEEMYRVLEDVKSVQREINSLQGKVERTFTVTDEMIFKVLNETFNKFFFPPSFNNGSLLVDGQNG